MRKFSKLFIYLSIASILISTAQAKSIDPCDNLLGNWQGKWSYWATILIECNWDADVKVEKSEGNVKLNVHATNTNHRHYCKNFDMVVIGSCEKGFVQLYTPTYESIHGQIVGNVMTLISTPYGNTATLTKRY